MRQQVQVRLAGISRSLSHVRTQVVNSMLGVRCAMSRGVGVTGDPTPATSSAHK